jgi:XTP/dITP diphosphohydrolase
LQPELLLATNNKGKVTEYRRLLADVPCRLVTPVEKGIQAEVEETGATFHENARLKAVYFAKASGILTLADDSGLEVAALGGEPGVRSARYAGEGADSARLVSFLLERMKAVPEGQREARFRCVIAIASPGGRVVYAEGECAGSIALEPVGAGGFGYDPVFFVPELRKTMAELSLAEKNAISHRGRAARAAAALLQGMDSRDFMI